MIFLAIILLAALMTGLTVSTERLVKGPDAVGAKAIRDLIDAAEAGGRRFAWLLAAGGILAVGGLVLRFADAILAFAQSLLHLIGR